MKDFTELLPVPHLCSPFLKNSDASRDLLNSVRLNFPINELTWQQWKVLEDIVDLTKSPPISEIVTFRLCENVEFCPENGVFLLVSRYLEVRPEKREIIAKKTVKVLPTVYPVEMYLKNYTSIVKL